MSTVIALNGDQDQNNTLHCGCVEEKRFQNAENWHYPPFRLLYDLISWTLTLFKTRIVVLGQFLTLLIFFPPDPFNPVQKMAALAELP